MKLRTSVLSLGFLILTLAGGVVFAQTVTGSISGRVVDAEAAAVPGAKVTLISETTSEVRGSQTDATGAFLFPSVFPGTYSVKVEKEGFEAFLKTGNVLTVAERLDLRTIKLSVGSIYQTVEVTAQGATVQSVSSEHSALLTSTQLGMLAVRGRDVINLLQLLPGVAYKGENESVGDTTVYSPQVNGGRDFWNSLMLDGMAGNDVGFPSSFKSRINMDAIGEVKVLLNNFQAEYGRNAGPMVNITTKAGTRDFHGAAYWYLRNEDLNANDFFNNRNNVRRPVYRYNTGGFTLGGPLIIPHLASRASHKVFFFYSLEEQHNKKPQPLRQVTVPTALERQGDFSQTLDVSGKLIPMMDPLTGLQFPGNVVPANRINQLGQGLLGIFPLPNAFDRSLTKGQYNYLFQESLTVPIQNHVFRVDLHRNDKDSLYVSGNLWYQNSQGYAVSAGGATWGLYRGQYVYTDNGVGINHTHIFSPRIFNEFTAGMRHGVEKGPALTQQDMDSMVRAHRGLSGLGQFFPNNNPYGVIPQTSFGGVPSAAAVSYDTRFPLRGADTIFNFTDGLSIIHGSHQFKAGVFADRGRSYKGETGTYSGSFSFAKDVNNPFDTNYAYTNALLGYFQSYTESDTRPTMEGRLWSFDWYLQDSWKVSRKLTLDYGVRFNWYTPIAQDNHRNLAATFAVTRYNPAAQPLLYRPVLVGGKRMGVNPVTGEVVPAVLIGAYTPGSGTPFQGMVTSADPNYPSGFSDHPAPIPEPRIGFSYDPFGNGKTAIRGGFGTTHNGRAYLTLRLLTWNPPVQQNPVVYYGNISSFLSSSTVLFPSDISGADLHNKTPGVNSWHLGVQRDVGFGTVIDVSYVGNIGRHLPDARNINTVPYGAHFLSRNADPTKPNTPLPDNFFRPNPGYGSITYYENASSSNYHALEITANRRFSRSVQFGVSYTWSKSMDYVDSDTTAMAMYQQPRLWNYGKAGFDQTHNFSLNYTWDLPRASRLAPNPVVKAVFDKWQLSGITRFVSGTPSGVGFSTTDGADITGGGDGARIVVTNTAPLSVGDRSFSKWFNTSVFARPAQGTFGNAPKDVFRMPGVNNWDISVFKNVPIGKKETRFVQLRWEMYNVFNHTQFSGVDATARFDPSGNQVNAQFGQVTSTRLPRMMQIALRLNF